MIYGLLEVSALCMIVIVFYYYFALTPDAFLIASPHPFTIIAAMIGIRYGNYVGIMGAVVCSLFYGMVYQDQFGEILSLLGDITYYKYILSIFWAAVILGIFKDNYEVVTQRLNNRIILLETSLEKLGRKYEESLAVNKDLKKQIIGAEHSILSLYEIASNLDSLDPESVYTETMGILKKFVNATTVSIYTVDRKNADLLRLKLRMGKVIGKDIRTIDTMHSNGFKRVVGNLEILKWNDTDEADFPLMSAPIQHDDSVIAVINIEDMDFDVLSEYAFNLFKVIVEWVSRSIGQAIFVETQLREDKYLEETNFLKYSEFESRLTQERRRESEFGLEFLYLKYHLTESEFEDVHGNLSSFMRSVDVFSYEDESNTIHILLPATPPSAFNIINERILKNLEYKVTLVNT